MGKYHGIVCKRHLRSKQRSEKFFNMKDSDKENLIISDLDEFENIDKISRIFNEHYGKIVSRNNKKLTYKYKKSSCYIEYVGIKDKYNREKINKLNNILDVKKCNSWTKKGTLFCKKHHELVKEKLCSMKMKCGCICGLITGNLKFGNDKYCLECYYKLHKKIPFSIKPASFELNDEYRLEIKESINKLFDNKNKDTKLNNNSKNTSNNNILCKINKNNNPFLMLNYDAMECIIQYISLEDLKSLHELNIPYVNEFIEKFILKKKICEYLLSTTYINFIYYDRKLYIEHMLKNLIKLFNNQFFKCENIKKNPLFMIKNVNRLRYFITNELPYCY